MTLQASGAISLSQVNTELGLAATANVSLGASNVRTLAGVASGLIALSHLYGKSNVVAVTGKGYFAGGDSTYTVSGTAYGALDSKIDGMDFITEAAINPSARLALFGVYVTGINSTTKGYVSGFNYGASKTICVFIFVNESSTTLSIDLKKRYSTAGVNSLIKGYFAGGFDSYIPNSIVDGILFSTETAFTIGSVIAVARSNLSGVNSNAKGYFAGGSNGTMLAEIDGINFSTDTGINPAATLSKARWDFTGVNSATRGYFAGGNDNVTALLNEIDGIDFATEAAINPSAALVVSRRRLAGVNSSAKGYFAGGETRLNETLTAEIDGIDFSTEAAINPSVALSGARSWSVGVQSGNL